MPSPTLDHYVPELYAELRRLAHRQLRHERPEHTLGTTALVHEAYLKLARLDRLVWQNRVHVLAEAARAMRRILVDHAVRRRAARRGGGRIAVPLEDALLAAEARGDDLLALHEALERLAAERPRHARIVECRFFAGMTIPDVAAALGVSPATVKRDWDLARAWLNRALADSADATG